MFVPRYGFGETGCELHLDLVVTEDESENREDLLQLSIPTHETCLDLKSREFVKYVISCSIGTSLKWEV